MKKLLTALLLSTLLYGERLSIATGEWSPWVSASLKHYGVASHITQEAFKTQGVDVDFNFYPWKRTYVTAKITKDDATGFWLKTEERERDFNFSDEIFTIKNVLVFKKGEKIDFRGIDELKNYKIAVTRGYSYSEKIDNMIKNSQIKVHIVNSDLAGLKQTLKKDIFDAFICSLNVAKDLLEKNFSKEQRGKIEFSKSRYLRNLFTLWSQKNIKRIKKF